MNAAFDSFVAPARPRSALWRLLAGLALIAALLLGSALLLSLAARRLTPLSSAAGAATLNTQAGALFGLATFILWWVALAAALRLLHRRGLGSVLGPRRAGRRRRFLLGVGAAGVFSGLGLLLGAAVFAAPGPSGLTPGAWAWSAAAAAPLILIQTGAEEALFRGYVMQQLAARFRSPLIWGAAPSLVFGLLHWSPAEGAALVAATTACLGGVLAAVTVRTGDLFAAWGLHFGVNIGAILLVSPADYFAGLALFHWPDGADLARLAWIDLGLVIALALIVLGLTRSRRAE
ncbi:CPBP family intramembrane glutamic endopeptidase [Pikeienuella sp. HZG-20]|uniref:CPBP family intramembrane glutamic endopeptidase n=1 Tax=Paludibacillus litoralis TaxID=3133267 RepID=UPI0030EF0B09